MMPDVFHCFMHTTEVKTFNLKTKTPQSMLFSQTLTKTSIT